MQPTMQSVRISTGDQVEDLEPLGARVGNLDGLILRRDDTHSVLTGGGLHRGAHLADRTIGELGHLSDLHDGGVVS